MKNAEEAIDQDRLHLVSAVDAEHASREAVHPEEGLPRLAATQPHVEDDHWSHSNPDLVIPEQRATCVYANKFNAIVIRQEKSWNEEDDACIYIHPQHVDALVEKLMQYKALCEEAISDSRK
jgi:hypothetical protein